ncbi:hypothetical protein BJ944DRAFT_234880 [Cunninghamella echinulata]|nr:hypothetical protein BJ944DRAFT_234880 [Cunninghamella echinulata]
MNNNNNNTPSPIRKVEGVEQEEQGQEDGHSTKQFQKQLLKCTATKSNRYYYGNKYNDSLKDSNRIIPTNEIALFMRRKRVYYPPHFKLIPPSSGGWEEVIPERIIDWDKTFDLQDDYYSSFLYVHTKEGPLDIPWNKANNKEKYAKKDDHQNQKDQQQEMGSSLNVNATASTSPTSPSSSSFSSLSSSSSSSLSSPSSSSSSSSTFSTNESICLQDQNKIKKEDTTTTTLLSPPSSHQYHHSIPSNEPTLTISTSQNYPLLLDNVTQENKKDTISLATPLKSLSSFNESKSDQYLNRHKKGT